MRHGVGTVVSSAGTGVGAPYDLVVPTIGRPVLSRLWTALAAGDGPRPGRLLVVDDRPDPQTPLPLPTDPRWAARTEVLHSGGRGPAAARNRGWTAAAAPWVAFLDDDVVPTPGWTTALVDDLDRAGTRVVAVQGRLAVPLPDDRRPTDWERDVAGLARAHAATADIAYRRDVLARTGGFDERFPAAYREDADLALRATADGGEIVRGGRMVLHPVGPHRSGISVRRQRGNADDALMRRRHGRTWRAAAHAGPRRFPRHAATTAGWAFALAAAASGHGRLAAGAGAVAALLTAELAAARIAPGPRTAAEITEMAATSVLIPPVAVAHRLRGELAVLRDTAWGRGPQVTVGPLPVEVVT